MPTYPPRRLPTQYERQERAQELDWLFKMPAPRKPGRQENPNLREFDTPQWRQAFGIPED